jgi:tetratricopeptide (TPR) repeat protein
MRALLLTVWLLLPVLVGAWHYGPGQEKLLLDDVARILKEADQFAADGDWADAEAKYEEALRLLPPGKVAEQRRVRLERAKAQMLARKLPVAHEELRNLVDELKDDPNTDPQLLAEARASLANAQYYMTWLMRLEGLPRDVWEPEIEAARQTYRLLAEEAESRGNATAAKQHQEDLESTIRLARMALSDLQGLPLPSQ